MNAESNCILIVVDGLTYWALIAALVCHIVYSVVRLGWTVLAIRKMQLDKET